LLALLKALTASRALSEAWGHKMRSGAKITGARVLRAWETASGASQAEIVLPGPKLNTAIISTPKKCTEGQSVCVCQSADGRWSYVDPRGQL